ncbi:MAG: S-layer homology domain-containing protein [Firmicutes bacterium]|nr:S-layer homology domain-containing protein [Bacillota bacterium]
MKKALIFIIIFLISYPVFGEDENETLLGEDDGYDSGYTMGELEGKIYGYEDFLEGNDNDWSDACPDNDDIEDEYNLDEEDRSYERDFKDGFKDGFEESYEETYRKWNLKDVKKSYEDGIKNGNYFGKIMGEMAGKKDQYSDDRSDWEEAIKSDYSIKKEYSLYDTDDEYSEGFLYGFKDAFKESYKDSFRDTILETNKVLKKEAIKNGQTIGRDEGELFAKISFLRGSENSWDESIPSDSMLKEKYGLLREEKEYRNGFLAGYKDGFKESFIETFRDENLKKAKGNIEFEKISMEGGKIESFDENVIVDIDEATFYKEAYIGIVKGNFPYKNELNAASRMYDVKINNSYDSINLRKPMKLKFKYEGEKNAGIYKLKSNKWLYLSSKFEDGYIYTMIDNHYYTGGTYAVFLDNNYIELKDINNHWAEEEINIFVRRNYISGYKDKTFKPQKSVSRGEFVTILDRIYNLRYPWSYNQHRFKDHMVFGPYRDSINKAVSNGYINGYTDNTFRPNVAISYQEIEWIIQRLPGKGNFKWEQIESKIIKEKGYRPASKDSMKKNITRAEIVYLFYNLNR